MNKPQTLSWVYIPSKSSLRDDRILHSQQQNSSLVEQNINNAINTITTNIVAKRKDCKRNVEEIKIDESMIIDDTILSN